MASENQVSTSVIMLPSSFNYTCVPEIKKQVLDLLTEGLVHFVIDFSNTDSVDSSGVGVLVSLSKSIKESEGSLLLKNLNSDVRGFFEETELDRIFNIVADDQSVTEAVEDLFSSSTEIRLTTSRDVHGEIVVLHLHGVIDSPVGPTIFKRELFLTMADHKKIVLDFDDLTFMDSSSMGVLVNMNKLLTSTGGSLRICCANYIISNLFNSCGISDIIPMFFDVEDALGEWN